MSPLSRSLPAAVPVALLKLSFAEVSVKEKPDRAARLGASSAPLMLVVSVWVALAAPSLTAAGSLETLSPSTGSAHGSHKRPLSKDKISLADVTGFIPFFSSPP